MTSTGETSDARPWGALAGLKVIDLTWAMAGPFGTMMLADMGATVIKVEGAQGDFTRNAGSYHPSDKERRHAGYFHSINRNKQGIVVDLKTEAGRQIIFDLVREADVLVENFRAGVMERLGLSWEVLREKNSRLIYAALRGFGDPRSGASPYVDWPAVDVVAQGMGGINSVTGEGPGQPMKVGPGIGDSIPGMYLAFGIVSALYSRERTGMGQFLDVSMVDSILAVSERIVYQHTFGKIVPGPVGRHQPMSAPFGLFPVKDGHVSICAPSDANFKVLCHALDAPELLTGKFVEPDGRRLYREELVEELERHTAKFTKAELMERLGGKIPFGPVFDIADIIADPHFKARDMLPQLELDGIDEPVAIAGVPVKMGGTPGGVHSPGPRLGQHTEEVLRDLDYSEEKIADLIASGTVVSASGA